jgi:hypothetical protein
MKNLLWFLALVLTATPAGVYLIYYYRRLGTRLELLKQTLLSLGLEDAYVRTRHGETYEGWRKLEGKLRLEKFTGYFDSDFRVGFSHKDYLWPVTLFTVFTGIGWFLTFSVVYEPFTDVKGAHSFLPAAFAYGFVGAWCASLLTIFDEFRKFNLDPPIYYSVTFRILFSSTAAYIASQMLKDSFSAPIAFGVGLFPVENTWRFITEKTAEKVGAAKPGPDVGAELANIQGLEDQPNRQKLLDIGISTVQGLATYDPLLLFFQTTFPLRTVVDMIDKAILHLYVGETVKELRQRGINGVIELVALARLAEQKPAYAGSAATAFSPFYSKIQIDTLIADVAAVMKQTPDQLKAFIYNLDYDPMVCFIYDIWGRYLSTGTEPSGGAAAKVVAALQNPASALPSATPLKSGESVP